MPASQSASTASTSGSTAAGSNTGWPREMLTTRMPYSSLWSTIHCSPASTSEVRPRPTSSRTRTETRLASGATPASRPPERLPLPTMMPATCVPWPLGSMLSSGGRGVRGGVGDDVDHRGQGLEVGMLGHAGIDDRDRHPRALERALRLVAAGLVGRLARDVHGVRHHRLVEADVVHRVEIGQGRRRGAREREGRASATTRCSFRRSCPPSPLTSAFSDAPGAAEAHQHVHPGGAVALRRLPRPGRCDRAACAFAPLAAWRCADGRGAPEGGRGDGPDRPLSHRRPFRDVSLIALFTLLAGSPIGNVDASGVDGDDTAINANSSNDLQALYT